MAKKKESLAIFSDKPTKDDLLNFKDYSELLADIVINSETPSTIGIFGDWGSGKTSLMLMVEDQLKNMGIKTIWFNAWKYDKEEALWRALILRILRDLTNNNEKVIDDTALKLYESIATEKFGQIQIDWLEIGKILLSFITLILAVPLTLFPGIVKTDFLNRIGEAFSRQKIQQSRDRISSIEQFEENYKEIIKKYNKEKDRIVIFIDDLDRCVPIRSLEVLEALKSFLDAEGCIYVVACDTRLINQGLRAKYLENSNIALDDYLGKIIQFSFSIPPIHSKDAEHFIEYFGLPICSSEVSHFISRTLERNPRKIKRYLNDLKIKNQLIKSRKLLLKPESLVKLSCISCTWQEFWLASMHDTSVFSRAEQIAKSPDGTEKSQDDIEFCNLFHVDDRLLEILNTHPDITQADLTEFIFLSTTTNTSLIEQQRKDETEINFSFQNAISTFDNLKINTLISRDETRMIVSAINNGESIIFLSGQFGSGKTTLLYLVAQSGLNNFISVYFNLGNFFQPEMNSLLYEIARTISQTLNEKGYPVQFSFRKDKDFVHEFKEYLLNVITKLKGKRLVIMLDEFSAWISRFTEHSEKAVMEDIVSIVNNTKGLTVIISSLISLNDLASSIYEPISSYIGLNIILKNIRTKDLENLFAQVMSMPIEEYKLEDAYSLLYLLENELRKIIISQFNEHDWWKNGIRIKTTTRLYERSTTKELSHEEMLSLLSLGDLFQIIISDENWETIFKFIFPSRECIFNESKSKILRARNSIAHSRDLTPKEMNDFVISARKLLEIIHPENFKQNQSHLNEKSI